MIFINSIYYVQFSLSILHKPNFYVFHKLSLYLFIYVCYTIYSFRTPCVYEKRILIWEMEED